MIRAVIVSVAAVVMVGCESTPPTEASPPQSVPAKTSPLAVQKATPKVSKTDNPSRVFQLRDLQRATVKVGGRPLRVWVMDDDEKRAEGMMFLRDEEVKDGEGMLFIFPDEAQRGFWMQNTVLALDIVYLDRNGKVVSVAKGKPFSEESLPSEGPAMYVVEVKQGMADRLGLRRGAKVTIPRDLTAKPSGNE